jgi:glutaconyl-CoA/methylmalonyl-CoA decarboxylase subunit gamma
MKYNVTIQDTAYVVEIEDINARPVIARVNGVRFEVLPDMHQQPAAKKEAPGLKPVEVRKPDANQNVNEMTAPLPGTVVEVFVKTGDEIEAGQVIVVIEAMKMKNSIRSVRAGKIADVLVSAMQTVAHKQPLVRFEI